jgi:hypothetical protein
MTGGITKKLIDGMVLPNNHIHGPSARTYVETLSKEGFIQLWYLSGLENLPRENWNHSNAALRDGHSIDTDEIWWAYDTWSSGGCNGKPHVHARVASILWPTVRALDTLIPNYNRVSDYTKASPALMLVCYWLLKLE